MMNTMDKTTLLLEQCRADMDSLAVNGDMAMNEALTKAERRAKLCAQEWRQASKAVELTGNQEKAVADARAAGEEKLVAATREEEDARIAADTVQRMIDDAATVRCVANKDTAKILERAENVLDETGQRAAAFYKDKKQQREGIEVAMQRLYTTEKAVLYTLAKARRNEGEKLLARIIADKKYEVSRAELEVLQMGKNQESLESRVQQQQKLLEQLRDDLIAAEQQVISSREATAAAEQDFDQQITLREQDIKDEVERLEQDERCCQQEKEQTQQQLNEASQAAAEQERASDAAYQQADEARRESESALAQAKAEHDQAATRLDEQLDQLRQQAARNNTAYIDAVAGLDSSLAEAERLRGIVADYAAKAAEAEAEEKSARDAVETANRLAENAIKIRESISSESSQLLLHAQEVLIEAANSARQLMNEKSQQRQDAEQECQLMSQQAAAVEGEAQAAEAHAAAAKAAWESAEQELRQQQEAAEVEREQLAADLAEKNTAAHELMEEAEAEAINKRQSADEAMEKLNGVQAALDLIELRLQRLAEEKSLCIKEGEERLEAILHLREKTLSELAEELSKAEKSVVSLQGRCVTTEQIVSELSQQALHAADQLRLGIEQVNELIRQGVSEIRDAEEQVQLRCGEEDVARLAAEEAVSKISTPPDATSIGIIVGNLDAETALDSAENIAELTEIIEGDLDAEATPLFPLPETEPEIAAEAEIMPETAPDFVPGFVEKAEPQPAPDEDFAEPQPAPFDDIAEPQPAPFDNIAKPQPEPFDDIAEPQPAHIAEDIEEDLREEEQYYPLEAMPEPEEYQPPFEPEPEEPPADEADEVPQLSFDFAPEHEQEPAISQEELEYTQRLEVLSNELLENTINTTEPEAPPAAPMTASAYQDWMDNLARSINDDEPAGSGPEAAESTAAAPPAPAADLDLSPLLSNDPQPGAAEDEDMPVISDVVLHGASLAADNEANVVDEDELRLSILSTVDEKDNKGKKRRFPFDRRK